MQINADALSYVDRLARQTCILTLNSSLQVFENESHASVHSDKTKEGLSLFGTYRSAIYCFLPTSVQGP
jgi:hypothetical protein